MLRDEYNKEKGDKSISKPISQKEKLMIKQYGERGFYNKSVAKITTILRSFNHLGKFSIFTACVLIVPILFAIILSMPISGLVLLFIISETIIVGFILIWYLILKPHYQNKLDIYKEKLNEIKKREYERQKLALMKLQTKEK